MIKKEITIRTLSSEGMGIGSDPNQGLTLFVEGALPKERVEVEIVETKKNYAKARLLRVVSPSPSRIKPACPLFGACGGCQIMHLEYSEQLKVKRDRVRDAFKKIGKIKEPDVLPCLASPQTLGYRNKIQLPIVWTKEGKKMGLYRKESHEIIPLSSCKIQCEQGEEILKLIDKYVDVPSIRHVLIRNAIQNKEALLIFVTNGTHFRELEECAGKLMEKNPLIKGVIENINLRNDNVILGKKTRLLAGQPYIFEKLVDKTFKISPLAFFQVNTKQTEALYKKVLELAELNKEETLLDAYSGVGTLSIFASDFVKEVIGIESVEGAVQDAKENALLNGASNCQFYFGKVEELIHKFDFKTLFLNPPRKGCDAKVIETILQKLPKKIIYISCDPATLARDVAALSSHYQVEVIQPLDMFPQTMHVETIVKLILLK